MSSFKSSEKIQKEEDRPDRSVSNKKILFSDPKRNSDESQRKHTVISSFNTAVNPKTDIIQIGSE